MRGVVDEFFTSGRVAPNNVHSPDIGFRSSPLTMNEARSKSQRNSSRGCLFTNFEDVQLTDEERVYMNAAALGDVPIIRQSLEEPDSSLNVNCVDYMGRSALHLAVDSENFEAIELLLDRLAFECIEESLLHAISKGATKIVKLIVEHPNYIAGEEQSKRTHRDPFFRTEEKSQFSPDITPLILAAHYNNHEIIQLFLSRNHTIVKPHPISCACAECVTKRNYDSLKRSRSRLNAYRALASPAYMALSSPDPIMTTFELRQEMMKLAQVEKEFKNEYLSLVEQCMDFACGLMDLCRGTQEVEAVLSEGCENSAAEGGDSGESRDPLARLKMAMEYEEKKFVAHPNCQQHLTSIWYGPETGFMQSLNLWKKILMWIVCVPLVPVLGLIYIISPNNKIGNALRCPASKFITHTLSHICFLILLAAATFRLEEKSYPISSSDSTTVAWFEMLKDEKLLTHADKVEIFLKGTLRPANILMTNVQICLMFWVLGLLWMECKQMYSSGVRVYLLDNYNWIDFIVLSLYLASYVLRFLVDHWIKQADTYFKFGTHRARESLQTFNFTLHDQIQTSIFDDERRDQSYYMRASRFKWKPDDPEIVSDVLFAVANVLSIARTTYLMPAFEVLGPLQISLGRMIGDITRFLVLFTLVLLAFMVGLHNLYWYYGSQTYLVPKDDVQKQVHTSEAFQGMPRTLFSLFWSMFGLVGVESIEIKYPNKDKGNKFAYSFPGGSHATSIVEGVGLFLFALYHVAIIIVLTNMLIAMMSHSFEDIQTDCDVEWKFARTRLWMNYIDDGNTMPVPFNMIPSPKSVRYAFHWIREQCCSNGNRVQHNDSVKRQTFIKIRREKVCQTLNIETPETNYADILQRLVRRYLFKLERQREESKDSVTVGADNMLAAGGSITDNYRDDREPQFADSDEFDEPHSPPPSINIDKNHLSPPHTFPPNPLVPPPTYGSATVALSTDSSNHPPPLPSFAPNDSQLQPTNRQPSSLRRLSIRPGGSGGSGKQGRGVVGRRSFSSGPGGNGACGGSTGGTATVQLLSLPQIDAIQRSLKLLDVRLQHVQANARDEESSRQDIEHIRRVMSENQKALATVVTVLSSIQEEVRSLSITVHRQQASTFHITAPCSGGIGASGGGATSTGNRRLNVEGAAAKLIGVGGNGAGAGGDRGGGPMVVGVDSRENNNREKIEVSRV